MKFCSSCGKPLTVEKPETHITCSHCMTENPVGSKFCSSCGRQLDGSGADTRQNKWWLKHFDLIDRILKYIAIACVIAAGFFIYIRANYIVDGPDTRGECCQGHCVEMEVNVHDRYSIVTAYDIDEFNVIYPCPYVKEGSLKTTPDPLNEMSLRNFTLKSVELYQIRATVQAVLWVGIAVFFFLIRKSIIKRKEKEANNIQ